MATSSRTAAPVQLAREGEGCLQFNGCALLYSAASARAPHGQCAPALLEFSDRCSGLHDWGSGFGQERHVACTGNLAAFGPCIVACCAQPGRPLGGRGAVPLHWVPLWDLGSGSLWCRNLGSLASIKRCSAAELKAGRSRMTVSSRHPTSTRSCGLSRGGSEGRLQSNFRA
jgi:hypothetical protein